MKYYLLLLLTVLISAFALSQSTPPTAPPASVAVQVGYENSASPRYEENDRPLSGVQSFDLGTRSDLLNSITPGFTLSETYGTNPGLIYGSQDNKTVWGSTTNVGGSLRMMGGNARQLFSLAYQGSAQLSSYDSRLNTQVHSLDVTESIKVGRWTYLIGDTLTYQPNAYAAYGPLLFPGSNAGIPGSDFRPGVTTNGSILTQQSTQITNSVLGQVTYGLSRSSFLTGSASFGTLNYLDGGLLDTRQFTGTGGYDHKFGRNTLGMSYSYSKFMYNNFAEDFTTNTIQATYGRRIIGRISFEVGAGPTFRTTTVGGVSTITADAAAQASLRYAGSRTNLGLAFSRAITGGSGVTAGALSNSVTASADRTLTRTLTGNLSAGFARNSEDFSGTTYNTLYVATGISQNVGRYASISIGYKGQRQTGNSVFSNLSTHSVAASILWYFRPIRLRK